MRPLFAAVLVAAFAVTAFSTPVLANDADDAAVKGVIQHFFTAIKSNDLAAMSADWEHSGTLVDGFAPFIWNGPGAMQNWWSAVQASFKKFGLEKIDSVVDEWQRLTIEGDQAFVVAGASAALSGTAINLRAKGTAAFILHRAGGVWRINYWSWAGPGPTPVAPPARQ